MTYLVLGLLIVAELVGIFVDEVDDAISGRGEIVLFAFALLLFFRRISSQLDSLHPVVELTPHGEALDRLADVAEDVEIIRVIANDGSKYYHLLSESRLRTSRLQLLLADTTVCNKWSWLVTEGTVQNLEIRRSSDLPQIHCVICADHGAVFGFLTVHGEHVSAGKPFVTRPAPGGRELTQSLIDLFDNEWDRSEIIRPVAP